MLRARMCRPTSKHLRTLGPAPVTWVVADLETCPFPRCCAEFGRSSGRTNPLQSLPDNSSTALVNFLLFAGVFNVYINIIAKLYFGTVSNEKNTLN